MTTKEVQEELERLNACEEGIKFVKKKGSIRKAWEESERGDWMLWYAQNMGVDDRKLTLAKAKCARLVEHLMEYDRSKKALEVAEKYGRGEATREDLEEARAAAYDAYTDVAADAAAAAGAAYAAAAAAVAANAAYATYSAAASYAAAAAYSARNKVLSRSADICREVLTQEIF